MQKYFRF